MAIDVLPGARGRTLVLDGLAQSDLDMNHFRLLNLDTSNLSTLGAPPTIVPPVNNWLKAWDNSTHTWTHQQINFSNLSGGLSHGPGGQQRFITELGVISVGAWQASVINPTYLPALNQIRAPIGHLNMANFKIIGLADPVGAQDAVNKRFMDRLMLGLNPKEQCRCASTTQVSFFGLQGHIDGVTLNAGDRVLVKNQFTGREFQNGIWIAATATWTRAADCNSADELDRAYVFVLEGAVNAGTKWFQMNDITTVDTDPVSFVLFSSGEPPGPAGPPGPGVADGGLTDQVLVKASDVPYDTEWVTVPGVTSPVYAFLQTVQTNPAGTSVPPPAGAMMGLGLQGGTITPTATGKVVVTINGFMSNDNAAGGVFTGLFYGTGTPPINGALPPVGSHNLGCAAEVTRQQAAGRVPFSTTVVITGLGIGIPVWLDLIVQAPSGIGLASLFAVTIAAHEIP